ncbi:MAG: alpha/beta fold hydrolase [Anaerolineae bacterium]|jgi:predicted peptidase|nr:alpha/beta fold hydrolase [Anaerolineae bacterium]
MLAAHYATDYHTQLRLDYLLSLPPDYAADDTRRFPLLFFLHGAGERSQHPAGLDAVKLHGVPKRVARQHRLPFIVAAPQCPADTWWPDHVPALVGLLDHLCAAYRVDERRQYLTGLSMGGFGTWHLAALYPQRFAAAVPICGGLPWYVDLESAAQRLRHLPLWVFHGARDDIVHIDESRRVVQALKAAGSSVKFTTYHDAGHDAWTTTYAGTKLYDWFLKHIRPA